MVESENVVIGVAKTVACTAAGTGRFRTNFSVQHLMVAARLAREVATTETENIGREYGPFFEVILGSSVGCVVIAASAAEAYINELFADRLESFTSHDHTLLDMLWDEYERKRVVEKFDLAHRLRTGEAMDKGSTPAQSMDRLGKLRNGIVHFKPEWSNEVAAHKRLSEQLEGYAGRSPWLPKEPLFPRAWATAATTSWAVATVLAFVAKFSEATGLPDRLKQFSDKFITKVP